MKHQIETRIIFQLVFIIEGWIDIKHAPIFWYTHTFDERFSDFYYHIEIVPSITKDSKSMSMPFFWQMDVHCLGFLLISLSICRYVHVFHICTTCKLQASASKFVHDATGTYSLKKSSTIKDRVCVSIT